MKDVIVIGGGVGGLSTAIYLRRAGFNVTVFEKNAEPGGKLSRLVSNGHTFDLGPTVLTMPFVLGDVFARCGERMEDHISLTRVEPTCRYNWSDGTRFDAWSDQERLLLESEHLFPEDVVALRRFFTDAETVYEATKEVFLFSPFKGTRELFSLRNSRLLPLLGKMGFTSSVYDSLRKRFSSEKLIQLFSRFATYNGSSPWSAPATLNVIPHVEFAYGAWYPAGGMWTVVEALVELADSLGVKILCNAEVESVTRSQKKIEGVVVNGDTVPADIVVSNADALWTWRHLLGPAGLPVPRHLSRAERSCSGFLILAEVEGTHQHLRHHNIFFSDAYEDEFTDIFNRKVLPGQMTVYVSVASRTDPSLAPSGSENWYILVNAPAGGDSFGLDVHAREYAEAVFDRLRWFGTAPVVSKQTLLTPYDIAERYNSVDGAIYGNSSNSIFSAFLRPANKVKGLENFFLASGSAHPGGGIPLVLLSGKITAGMITEQFG